MDDMDLMDGPTHLRSPIFYFPPQRSFTLAHSSRRTGSRIFFHSA